MYYQSSVVPTLRSSSRIFQLPGEILPCSRATRSHRYTTRRVETGCVAREKRRRERRGEERRGTEVGNLENGPPGRDHRSYPRAANLHSIIRCNQIDSPRYGTSGGSFYRGKLSLRTTLLHYFWWFVLRTDRERERERGRGKGGNDFRGTWFHRKVFRANSPRCFPLAPALFWCCEDKGEMNICRIVNRMILNWNWWAIVFVATRPWRVRVYVRLVLVLWRIDRGCSRLRGC